MNVSRKPRLTLSDERFNAQSALDLLHALETDPAPTQRTLATSVGIALGLTNAYIKRAINKGWVKIRQVPPRRYAYYLTPQGFTEKSRLTREYLTESLRFFRRARNECGDLLQECAAKGWTRVALMGAGDLAEIATLAAHENGVRLVAVIDAERNASSFAGLPLVRQLPEAGSVDVVLLTDMKDPQGAYDSLCPHLAADRIVVPKFLRVARRLAVPAE